MKEDFFQQDKIDWLKEQKNGCEYIVLYLQLCLMSANNDGKLIRNIGEIMIPYDEKKIAEKTGFAVDTVVVAFGLFRKLGLMFYDPDGTLVIPEVAKIVGSETDDAARKRRKRAEKKLLELEMSKRDSASATISGQCPDSKSANNGKRENIRTMSGKNKPKCPENVIKTATNALTLDKHPDNVPENVTLEKEIDKSLYLSSLKEKDKRENDNDKKAAEKEVIDLYRNNVSPMMGEIELEKILDCIGHYGPVWTKEAIEVAVSRGKRHIAYIEGILKNWEVEGHDDGKRSGRNSKVQRKARKATDGSETDWDAEAGKGWDD